MKKLMTLSMLVLLLAACGERQQEERPSFPLQGAWLLEHRVYPGGSRYDYAMEGDGTYCLLYDRDSTLYGCHLATTPTGLVLIPTEKAGVTLIDKGGGERLYLEGDDPHPLTIEGDSAIVIQRMGSHYYYRRADDLYRQWGAELTTIISREADRHSGDRFVLSEKERQQEKTIMWYGYFSASIVVILLLVVYLAIGYRRAKRQLQLQLQQIQEVQANRQPSVRQAVATVENDYFASDDYAALRRRVASGQRLDKDDWQQVERQLMAVYPGFASQLRSLYPMSELEYQVCLLIKLRIQPKDIAAVLARDTSTISTVRSRLYKKVFGRKGGTKEWDDFVLSIGV